MANYRSRNSRERRLRARYRKKIWTCGIIMLIVGLVAGYVLCVMFPAASKIPSLLGVDATPTPVIDVSVEPTAEPTPEPTDEPTAEPTAEPTVIPTAEPAAQSTDVPDVQPAIVFNSVDVAAAQSAGDASEEPTVEPTVEATEETTVEPTEEPTLEPTVEATAEPTAEPTVEPTPAPIIVPFGESCTFDTQITADGKACLSADAEDVETLNLTLTVRAYKDPAYFEEHYADAYNLQGNEAAVEFDLSLNGYAGSTEIIPQNFLLITFCGEDEDDKAQGFQLMDSEIAGKTDIAIANDTATTLYKRYAYNADQGDMVYMVVTTYNGGAETTYWFEIQGPEEEPQTETGAEGSDAEAAATAEPETSEVSLTVGSTGPEVSKLQAKLIELGLLTGSPDGKFGKYTAGAVEIMQGRFGMEKTGVADAAFLAKLYE